MDLFKCLINVGCIGLAAVALLILGAKPAAGMALSGVQHMGQAAVQQAIQQQIPHLSAQQSTQPQQLKQLKQQGVQPDGSHKGQDPTPPYQVQQPAVPAVQQLAVQQSAQLRAQAHEQVGSTQPAGDPPSSAPP